MLTEILSACENVDEQAFMEHIYDEYKYIMIKTARKYVSDPDIVDELVQDSLVKLITKTPLLMSFERCTLISYIVCTVKNTAINHLRYKAVVKQHISDQEIQDDTHWTDHTDRSIEDLLISSMQMEQLGEILEQLPEKDQYLLRGKYQLYLTDEELARTLNCKTGSVRMMLTRARRRALEELKKEEFSYGNK